MSLFDVFKPKPKPTPEPTEPMLKPNPDAKIQRTPKELELMANWKRHQQ